MAYCECENPDNDGPRCKKCGNFVRGYSFYEEEMCVSPDGEGNDTHFEADRDDMTR